MLLSCDSSEVIVALTVVSFLKCLSKAGRTGKTGDGGGPVQESSGPGCFQCRGSGGPAQDHANHPGEPAAGSRDRHLLASP